MGSYAHEAAGLPHQTRQGAPYALDMFVLWSDSNQLATSREIIHLKGAAGFFVILPTG